MIYNEDLKKLFEIIDVDPETIFKGGLGVYKQQQAEHFMEKIVSDAHSEGYDEAQAGIEEEIEDAIEEKECDIKGDIEHYINYNLFNDYKKYIEENEIDVTSEEFTLEKQFEIIRDIILENI